MRLVPIIFLFLSVLSFFPVAAKAFEIDSDPQYVVMNFATINELDWSAPDNVWQMEVKPKVLSQIHELTSALPKGTSGRKLAWSTLMEYMNFSLDVPGPNSPYAVKMRRILEITDELNLPVFIPLNGFQWWDQLPELYNWWDPEGKHTDPNFFARQKNPEEFKQRFIAGYNANNKWNVEWQDHDTPMRLNFRNWGGGGFRLAPPPNLSNIPDRAPLTYRSVLTSRLKTIIGQIIPFLSKWERENRRELFAGVTIGTEISLNASIKPEDEFQPYGFRGVQDTLCVSEDPSCGKVEKFSSIQIDTARRKVINTFLLDMTRMVNNLGIPKQRLYTHVWGEAVKGDARHVNYADAAFTLYSRPGMSFYGYAENPLSLPDWRNALNSYGLPSWGAVEYSAGENYSSWKTGLSNNFDNSVSPAKVAVIYNWQEHKNTGAILALRDFLQKEPVSHLCSLPEIIPQVPNASLNPALLKWKFLGEITSQVTLTLHIKEGIKTHFDSPSLTMINLNPEEEEIKIPQSSLGIHSWYLEMQGCGNKRVYSEPRTLVNVPSFESQNPKLIDWIIDLIDFARAKIPKGF